MSNKNFKQGIVAVFGQPVAENPTQVMIEAAFAAMGLDWRYLTLEVAPADLGRAVAGARAMGFHGFNCTIPHKVAVIPFLDLLGASARLMGAVNCVVHRNGKLIGENTDGKGFLLSLPSPPKGRNVVVLGAGGAARAIAVELALAGAGRITIVNRDRVRGQALADLLTGDVARALGRPVTAEFVAWAGDYTVPANTHLLVNATSIGLYPDVDARIPIDERRLDRGTFVADVIPNPPQTRLIRAARAAGCEALEGLDMLVMQGVIGVEHWTGRRPDRAVMRSALQAVFSD